MNFWIDTSIRALIASPFLMSAVDKALRPAAAEKEIEEIASRSGLRISLPLARVTIITVQGAGGLAMLVPSAAGPGALLLAAFLIPVTVVAHAFWAVPLEERAMKRDHFLGNAAILGGLLLVALTSW